MPPDARLEYCACLAARITTREALSKADERLAHARIATFAVALFLAIFAWRGGLSAWWLVVPAAIFAWLVQRHDRALRSRDGAIRGIAFYERGLARLDDRWAGRGEPGERFRDDRHVYANDLDLFGRGSLFELLSLARTQAGEETLARWLTSPAEAVEIRTRQAAVEELAPAVKLREQLALAGTDLRESVHTDRLLAWAESPIPKTAALRLFTFLLTAVPVAAVAYLALSSEWWPLAVAVLLQTIVFTRFREQMNVILSGKRELDADFVADALTHRTLDLDVIAGLLQNLERERFSCDHLRSLRNRLDTDGVPASRVIRRLHRLAEVHASTGNTAIFPVVLFLLGYVEIALCLGALLQLIRPHVTLAADRWRKRHGMHVRVWLETIAQFEALSSLSAYRFEHMSDPFPEIVSSDDGTRSSALFEGTRAGPSAPARRGHGAERRFLSATACSCSS